MSCNWIKMSSSNPLRGNILRLMQLLNLIIQNIKLNRERWPSCTAFEFMYCRIFLNATLCKSCYLQIVDTIDYKWAESNSTQCTDSCRVVYQIVEINLVLFNFYIYEHFYESWQRMEFSDTENIYCIKHTHVRFLSPSRL